MQLGMSQSLEDEVLQGVQHVPRAHSRILIDIDQYFYGISVHFRVVVLEVLDLDDLLEEYVDFSTAVTRQVVVLDHADQISIG